MNELKDSQKKLFNNKKAGERSMANFIWPSPHIFLMRECGLLLAANGSDIENYYTLAKLIRGQSEGLHYQSISNKNQHWGKGYRKIVKNWLVQVSPYIGRFGDISPTGVRTLRVFPSVNQFPTRSSPTILRCIRIDENQFPVFPPKELFEGPGWGKADHG